MAFSVFAGRSPPRARPNRPPPRLSATIRPMSLTYTHHLQVPASAIDENGHVNNVEFIRWMQDAAVAHADAVGCSELTRAHHAIWVVRRHEIEYRRQAFVGDQIEVRTGIADCRHVSSRRKYEFFRPSD